MSTSQTTSLVELPPLMVITERVALLCSQNLAWKPDYARRVASAYRQFLHLKVVVNDYDTTLLVPCIPVNIMWQQHILNTKNYANDCQTLFGRWLHHDFAGGCVIDNMNNYAKMMATLSGLQAQFGSLVDRQLWGYPDSAFVPDNTPALAVKTQQKRSKASIISDSTNHDRNPPPGFSRNCYLSSTTPCAVESNDVASFRVVSPAETCDSMSATARIARIVCDSAKSYTNDIKYQNKDVSIAVTNSTTGEKTFFCLKGDSPLSTLFQVYDQGKDRSMYIFKGKRIDGSSTPHSIGFVDGDSITAVFD